MVDLLIENGSVVTMDPNRTIINDGAVVIEDDTIRDVGPTDAMHDAYDPTSVIDATNKAVLPGFITTHAHISCILLRGGGATDRPLYDWLFNVIKPARNLMDAGDHEIASALYAEEAIKSGITTVMENAIGGGSGYADDIIDAKFHVYDTAGFRNIFGQSFIDREMDPGLKEYIDILKDKEPEVVHVSDPRIGTDEALDNIESLIEQYHGSAEGRQSVWPAPLSPRSTTVEGLRRTLELAEKYDVMTTTHVSESIHEESAVGGEHLSMVDYLHQIDYLGDHTLLGHCVHLTDRDIRLLAQTNTRVAHNILSNLTLGSGIARIPTMLNYGVTVGMGTDNASASDMVNMLSDMRFALLVQKGVNQDSDVMTPETVVEMATIDAAHAIGREEDLGSLEPGKKADVVLIDLEHTHMTPRPNIVPAIVYQTQGFEVETVICNGEIIMEDRRVRGIENEYPDLHDRAQATSMDIIERTGLTEILGERPWKSVGHRSSNVE